MVLDEFIGPAEKQLELALEEARQRFANAGYKGGVVEEAVRVLLRRALPARLSVGEGEILDKEGHRSGQSDIVIATDDHPRFLTRAVYLIEGVVACGEIKTHLTAEHLQTTLDNARVFKELKPESGEDEISFGPPEQLGRYYRSRPFFLFAMESDLALDTVADRIQAASAKAASEGGRTLDAAFIYKRGWIIDLGDGNEKFRRMTRDKRPMTGWQVVQTDAVLFEWLGWLSAVMPRPWLQRPVIAGYLDQSST